MILQADIPLTARASVLRPLLELVASTLPALPPGERADMLSALAVATVSAAPKICRAANKAAKAIREAEAQQLNFAALLHPTPEA